MMFPFPDANLPDRDSSEGCVEGRSLPGTLTTKAGLGMTAAGSGHTAGAHVFLGLGGRSSIKQLPDALDLLRLEDS
jgi:hypothetical protein